MAVSKNKYDFEYDIALSFAGEERWYVEIVAKELKSNRLIVFYDEYEKVDLWGKFLPDHLTEVYSNKALFCVIFISDNYAKKVWTNVERRSAISRAIRQKDEYILPARFDDTEIVGLVDISYFELYKYTPYEFSELIINKVKVSTKNSLKSRLKKYVPKSRKFNYKLNFFELSILETFDASKIRYRAISKIAQEINMDKEFTRGKLNFLKGKGLVNQVKRPTGDKWMRTTDGKDYLEYFYSDLDESSG